MPDVPAAPGSPEAPADPPPPADDAPARGPGGKFSKKPVDPAVAAAQAAQAAEAKRSGATKGKGGARAGSGRKAADAWVQIGESKQLREHMELQTAGVFLTFTQMIARRQGEHWLMGEEEARVIAASGIRMCEAYGFFVKGIPAWFGFALACLPYALRAGGGEWARLSAARAAAQRQKQAPPEPPATPRRPDAPHQERPAA